MSRPQIGELLRVVVDQAPEVPPIDDVIRPMPQPRRSPRRPLVVVGVAIVATAVVVTTPSLIGTAPEPASRVPAPTEPSTSSTSTAGVSPMIERTIGEVTLTLERHDSGCLRVVAESAGGPASSSAACGPEVARAGNTVSVESLFAGEWFGVVFGSAADDVTDVEVTLSTGDPYRTTPVDGVWLLALPSATPWDVTGSSPVVSVEWLRNGDVVLSREDIVGGPILGETEASLTFDVVPVGDDECLRVWVSHPDGTGGVSRACEDQLTLDDGLIPGVVGFVGAGATGVDGPLQHYVVLAVAEDVDAVVLTTVTGSAVEMEIGAPDWDRSLAVATVIYDLDVFGGPGDEITVTVDGLNMSTDLPYDMCDDLLRRAVPPSDPAVVIPGC